VLRDMYAYGSVELKEILNRFALNGDTLVDVKMYKMITPDSFIWKLRMAGGIYYLYAEDFIQSLNYVKSEIEEFAGKDAGHFIEATDQKDFEEMTPVVSAAVYEKPEDFDETLIKYAVDSGYDMVFLYKVDRLSDEDKSEL